VSVVAKVISIGIDAPRAEMSDTLQALLDSGALYLVFGAVICIVLGIGAAKRLFKGANRIKNLGD
jgi:hypothetical protein